MLKMKGVLASIAAVGTDTRLPHVAQRADSAGPKNVFLSCDIARWLQYGQSIIRFAVVMVPNAGVKRRRAVRLERIVRPLE